MRAQQLNLTTSPRLYFQGDKNRGIFICRNTNATDKIYVQFGAPGGTTDGFPILAGDTLTIDRGDLSQEIYIWSDSANSNNILLVG